MSSRQVKTSSGATRPRGDHPNPYLFLPRALRGLWRSGVGRYIVGGISAGQQDFNRRIEEN